MNKQIQVALIGCGTIATEHLRALSSLEDIKIATVCDIVPERAQTAAEACGAAWTTDWREAVAGTGIESVHICTPHYLHTEMAIHALDAGKYVLCEKPMATSAADAQAMIAHAHGRLGLVYQNRYNECVATAKRLLDEGTLGRPLALRASVCWKRDAAYYAQDAWRGKWATEGGGLLINQAIHTVDLMQYLGGPVTSIKGSYTTDFLQGTVEVEENAHAVMRLGSGIIGLLHASNSYIADAPPEIRIALETGELRLVGSSLLFRRSGELTEDILVDAKAPSSAVKAVYGSGHRRLIADFYQAVRARRSFWIDGEAGFASLWTVLAVYASSETGAWISRENAVAY